jgi:hypothetical protein
MIWAANVGVTNIPGNIAESDMITTPARPMVLAKEPLISSVAPLMSPFTTLLIIFSTVFFAT